MRELELDPSWPDEIKNIHAEHRLFADPRIRPNTYSWYWQRTNDILALVERELPKGSSVLDIGCAQGTIAICLAEHGYRVTGNDIRSEYLSYARMRDNRDSVCFVVANFEEYRTSEPFDAIVFTEVIEHVVDHQPFLKNIWACLKPGGLIIVTTPNHDYFRETLPSYSEVNLLENKHREFTAHGSDHFYLFRKEELNNLISSCGFEIIEHRYFLPFLQFGVFKLHLLWFVFPMRFMEWLSRRFDGSRLLCAQQIILARKI